MQHAKSLDRNARAAIFSALGDPHRLAIVDALAVTDLTPSDLGVLTGLETNHLAHHLGLLESAGLVVRTRSEGDGRRRYVTLGEQRLDQLLSSDREHLDSVTFVCTANSARSQFAAARYHQLTGRPAASAGTHPAPSVHPGAVEAALRYGLDLSTSEPRNYSDLPAADVVISVCDRALEHGLPPHRRHLHWSIPDPARAESTVTFDEAFALIDRRLARTVDSSADTP